MKEKKIAEAKEKAEKVEAECQEKKLLPKGSADEQRAAISAAKEE
jgi:hypothetical protein|tara:strand:+ start:377 stop:511 length:135 start_codon:yes stop_codon:yes gene_type:complete